MSVWILESGTARLLYFLRQFASFTVAFNPKLYVIASASAGVGSITSLLLHNAEAPNSSKARR
jgi:hypothetical protein